MNIDEILTLVQAVSDSKLTSFKLDQGDMHISLKKEKEEAKIITVSAPGAVAAVPASTAAPVLTAASTGVSTEHQKQQNTMILLLIKSSHLHW